MNNGLRAVFCCLLVFLVFSAWVRAPAGPNPTRQTTNKIQITTGSGSSKIPKRSYTLV